MSYSFQILGPIRVTEDGAEVPVPGGRVRVLLAALLARANRTVATERLATWLWQEGLPANPKAALHTCVSRLRTVLGEDVVRTTAGGYQIVVDEQDLDLAVFTSLVARADRAERRGDLAAAAALLGDALDCWRGEVFGGVRSESLRRDEGARLAEQRFTARRRWAEFQSMLGEHGLVVTELTALCAEHPLREDLRELLMLALHRAGRRADALTEYRRVTEVLATELGLDPSPALQRVHHAILNSAPELAIPAATPRRVRQETPAELPAASLVFTGREADLERLDRLLLDDRSVAGMALIVGTAGIGKTALAVRWGHRAAPHFPDGQLYVNLLGFTGERPMSPAEALAGLLQSLGVAAERVPADVDRAAALYRTVLAERRMLIVLDNAAAADQVRPLLPGTAGCAVVITSRDRLPGLSASHGVSVVRLGPLTPEEARTVLTEGIGAAAAAEPDAVAALAELCANLPLALRIAAVNSYGRPRVADYVAELRAARLSALAVDDDPSSAVRPAFQHSYDRLDPRTRRVFRLLAAVAGADVSAAAVAALSGTDLPAALGALDLLVRSHLVDEAAGDRYASHDLLRSYAAELADEGELDDARICLLDWYTYSADAATDLLDPGYLRLPLPPVPHSVVPLRPRDGVQAIAWFDRERDNLVAAVVAGVAAGATDRAWRLGATLRGYFARSRRLNEWSIVARATEHAAETTGDPLGTAAAAVNSIQLALHSGDYHRVVELGETTLALVREVGWVDAEGAVHTTIGLAHQHLGDLVQAVDSHGRALAIAREPTNGAAVKRQIALDNLSTVYELMGRLDESIEHATRVLALCDRTNDEVGRALALFAIGTAEHQRGNFAVARTRLTACVDLASRLPHRLATLLGRMALSRLDRDVGDLEPARAHATAAAAIAVELGDLPRQVRAGNALASIDLAEGRIDDAAARYRQALAVADSADVRQARVEALVGLATVDRHRDDLDRATALAAEAVAAAEIVGALGHGVRAHIALAEIHLAAHRRLGRDSLAAAAEHARHAIAGSADTGHRVERARALACLAAVLDDLGDASAATQHVAAAALRVEIGLPEPAEVG